MDNQKELFHEVTEEMMEVAIEKSTDLLNSSGGEGECASAFILSRLAIGAAVEESFMKAPFNKDNIYTFTEETLHYIFHAAARIAFNWGYEVGLDEMFDAIFLGDDDNEDDDDYQDDQITE